MPGGNKRGLCGFCPLLPGCSLWEKGLGPSVSSGRALPKFFFSSWKVPQSGIVGQDRIPPQPACQTPAHGPSVPDSTHVLAQRVGAGRSAHPSLEKRFALLPRSEGTQPTKGFTGGSDGIIKKAALQNAPPGSSKVCTVCDHLLLYATHQHGPFCAPPTPAKGRKWGWGPRKHRAN